METSSRTGPTLTAAGRRFSATARWRRRRAPAGGALGRPGRVWVTPGSSPDRAKREPPVGWSIVREQPQQQPPPVQRLRVRYAKRGRLRFTSHRDFSRAFERALVRAQVPMAYSSGFNPHPRISYAGAAPTGSASEAEYLEIGLAGETDPDDVRARLDEALPPGLDVLEVVTVRGGVPGRPAAGQHLAAHAAGRRRAEEATGGRGVPRRHRGRGRADDQARSAHLRLPRRRRRAEPRRVGVGRRRSVRYSKWSCGTARRP